MMITPRHNQGPNPQTAPESTSAVELRDWLPERHLAWFVLDAVAGMDLGEFYAAYRRDGVGRRAYDPAMMA